MGIRHEFKSRYTPEQNGVVERKNQSVVEAVRTKFYWSEAVRTTVHIKKRIGENVSAHELYFGRMPNLRHLRVFRSIAYVHVPKEK